MGAASGAILCVICCACILVGAVIAFFVWAIVTLVKSAPSNQSECGKDHGVWEFCLAVVIVMPMLGIVVNAIASFTKNNAVAAIPTIIGFAVTIWGIVILAYLGECEQYYQHSYPDLLLLFKIYVILSIVVIALALCFLGCAVCLLGTAVLTTGLPGMDTRSSGRPDGYSDLPGNDGNDSAKDERLRAAARDGRLIEVEQLLSGEGLSANVNARDPANGWAPLHYAAFHNHRRVAERLVAAGAKLDAETMDRERKTALRLAEEKGNDDVVAFLRSVGAFSYNDGGADLGGATMEFV